jgi:hypothetical protein
MRPQAEIQPDTSLCEWAAVPAYARAQPDTAIDKTAPRHFLWVVNIAQINHNRRGKGGFDIITA